ncbi:MAG: hypothetical protein ACE5HX_05020 [bacterium]
MENNIEVITKITYLFFIYLILAIFVERIVEVFVSVFNYAEFKRNFYEYWNKKALNYQKRFDRLYGYQSGHTPQTDKILNWVLWKVVSEKPYVGGKEIISADLIRLNYIRIITRVFAFVLSLGFAIAIKIKLGIDLVVIIESLLPNVALIGVISKINLIGVLLTAVALSIGSEPLHQVINRIEKIERRKRATAQGGSNA